MVVASEKEELKSYNVTFSFSLIDTALPSSCVPQSTESGGKKGEGRTEEEEGELAHVPPTTTPLLRSDEKKKRRKFIVYTLLFVIK